MALDSAGNLYVANYNSLSSSVSVFARGANGCVTGNRVIAGPHTGIAGPWSLAINGSTLYVGNLLAGPCGPTAILAFSVNASGDTAPSYVITGSETLITGPWGIGFDNAGNMYVADNSANPSNSHILVFSSSAKGNVAPIRNISGPHTGLLSLSDLSVRHEGTVYAAAYDANSVSVFPPQANGDVAPIRVIQGPNAMINFPLAVSVAEK
jgi:DNA-binding beta-propeller fold protein YncE